MQEHYRRELKQNIQEQIDKHGNKLTHVSGRKVYSDGQWDLAVNLDCTDDLDLKLQAEPNVIVIDVNGAPALYIGYDSVSDVRVCTSLMTGHTYLQCDGKIQFTLHFQNDGL